ncbi:CDP-glycerol glycerophosphotransferase family protein [Cytobacillus pseudoceanisediminis]|uniref:CDP-glycerol glycerophosphotransferase family protein n=1 Tax=Cytobacillus pseudoceanisediminis TaxID=3051614 RepID=UPI0034E24009
MSLINPVQKNVTCLQVWHASGAIKQFGLKDPSIANRKSRAITRFKKVYKQFHNIIVGSEEMARIFGEAFGIEEKNILRTGMPRTDVFFNEKRIALIKKYMYQKFPYLEEKRSFYMHRPSGIMNWTTFSFIWTWRKCSTI